MPYSEQWHVCTIIKQKIITITTNVQVRQNLWITGVVRKLIWAIAVSNGFKTFEGKQNITTRLRQDRAKMSIKFKRGLGWQRFYEAKDNLLKQFHSQDVNWKHEA